MRDDFDELFLMDGVDGVSWMFDELEWLDEDARAERARFEAAVAALDSLGDAVFDDGVVRGAAEWRELRASAASYLAAIPERPWAAARLRTARPSAALHRFERRAALGAQK